MNKQEYEAELRTFKEIYIKHQDNLKLKDMCADIIAWYQEQIALIERIAQYAREYLTGNTADKKRIIQYP